MLSCFKWNLIPGTTVTAVNFGTITGGTVDEAASILSFTDGTYLYEGTIADDKSFNGTARDINDPNFQFPFSLSYTYASRK